MSERQSRILIVDDDNQNMAFVQEILRLQGYLTCSAHDGFEGLDLFEKLSPDLVMLDWLMPRLGGNTVCRKLRRHTRGHTVPIIVMTGLTEPEDRQAALDAGADGFLTKPIARQDLVAQVQALLARETPVG